MKHLIIITVLFMTGILSAQSNYDKGMQKAVDLWENNQWTEAEQRFERIAVHGCQITTSHKSIV